ncbi:MAG: antitoxin [Candidatus Nanopelagicales bacterium]|jgi:hypothetical protein|nr:antitoxin [Candidatus Nanopelagicales bacterium]
MGIGDMINQAKDAVTGGGATDEVVDKVADEVKERTPDQVDPAVDQAAQAVKDQL